MPDVPKPMTDETFDSMLLAMGPFSTCERRIIDYAISLRARAERAEKDSDVLAEEKRESGWLIERWFNGELRYWIGNTTEPGASFLPDNAKAIRFARERDAAYVLAWCLGGNGRVAEHVWTDASAALSRSKGGGA